MAQQFIKIFDDTVLKQSVNQGYESQRTNSRLGKFTMGELAFTRDTARLFVGNSTTLNLEKDSGEVTGGSLVGNKYLGLIDSKPLTHFQRATEDGGSTETTVHLPLEYETDTISKTVTGSDGFKKSYTEKALLKSESKFRTDTNNGWNKEASYNHIYDAYNGDYVFDVFNNALIIFDKNIKKVNSTAPKNWEVDSNNVQHFKNDEGDFYTEEGGKLNYSKYRTRIQNAEKIASTSSTDTVCGNPDYPVYGDGYVIMRIVEPDGITIGYREKQFNQADGTAIDNNYSHNYLEIKKVRPESIFESLNPTQFTLVDGQISVTANMSADSLSSASELTLPSKIKILNGPTFTIKTNSSSGYNNNGYLATINGITEVVDSPTIKLVDSAGATISEGALKPGETLQLKITSSGGGTTTTTGDFGYIVSQPWNPGSTQTYSNIYVGNCQFTPNGTFKSFEEVVEINPDVEATQEDPYGVFGLYDSCGPEGGYKITKDEVGDETTITYSGKFPHPYVNTGLNFLKNPEPIAWGIHDGSGKHFKAKAQFFIYPYVISPKKFNNVYTTSNSSTLNTDSNFMTIGASLDIGDKTWDKDYASGITTDIDISKGIMGVRIPDHASSIICEFHAMLGAAARYVITTATDWTQCTNTTTDYLTPGKTYTMFDPEKITLTSIPQIKTATDTNNPGFNGVKCLKSFMSTFDDTSNKRTFVEIIEIPLYRDKNKMKYFNVGVLMLSHSADVTFNSKWLLRAIGYRA